jgi:hexosaminidase
MSPADVAYLDMKFDADSPLGLTWAKGVTTLQDAYGWEPTTIIDGVDEQRILGVEAPLWSETARDLGDIEQLAFPRIGAIAEIAWSPASTRDQAGFEARTAASIPRWTAAGIAVPAH